MLADVTGIRELCWEGYVWAGCAGHFLAPAWMGLDVKRLLYVYWNQKRHLACFPKYLCYMVLARGIEPTTH